MRWLLLLLLLFLIWAPVVYAGSQDVTVTVTGVAILCPGGFALTYVSNYEIILSWTNPVGAPNTTMVRAAVGRDVTGPTDGYLVYQGTNTTATDWVNLDGIGDTIYYRAYGVLPDGTVSTCFVSGDTGGISMHITGSWLLLSLIGLCLGLTYLSLKADILLLRLATALGWIALAFMFFTNVFGTDIGDPWTSFVAFLFLLMAFVTLFLQMSAEVKHERKGYSFSSWGQRPKDRKPSAYQLHREAMRERLRRVR